MARADGAVEDPQSGAPVRVGEGFGFDPRYWSVSLRELLQARDAYHVHLLNLPNVVGTAIGRYLIRDEERGLGLTIDERLALPPGTREARTLANSSVQPDSWPCVLVFVSHWMDADEIQASPDDMVPRRLYLPDGLRVPTCVVYAPGAAQVSESAPTLRFPSDLLGGGYVCLADVQGIQRVGSIGCLVSDGERLFALTNRHVAGERGRELYTLIGGAEVPIGRSAGRSVGRRAFEAVYPSFVGERVEVAIDAGLIDIDDATLWTTQVFGVGRLGQMVDVRPESMDLTLIGQRLRAFGAGSGALAGSVAALFYRYATRSGVEYVADAIVAPNGVTATRPGDSGTLWVLEPDADDPAEVPRVRPLAMQWGGHRFDTGDAGALGPYALVSFLSTVCRALDVEPLSDWNDRHDRYWGEVGHYTIGARACDRIGPEPLRRYFLANRSRISFELTAILSGDYKLDGDDVFYPLADVPDNVWKPRVRPPGWRAHEGPNHFADMDDPLAGTTDTLLARFAHRHDSVNPAEWIAFYEAQGMTPKDMGLLPFRVAQLYRVAVESLRAGEHDKALVAAGVMAHYVGDACQPLHVSRLHHGRTPDQEDVHAAYETRMVTGRRAQILAGLDVALSGRRSTARVHGHREVAIAVVSLMARTVTRLPPERICDVYARSSAIGVLWKELGEQTIECMADGCRTLATLWASAWEEAGVPAPPAVAADPLALKALYDDHDFAASLYLPELAATFAW